MIKVSKTTSLDMASVLDRASAYFGAEGLGLEEQEREDCRIVFEGGGGHVALTVRDGEEGRVVDIESREWDHPVKEFLGKL